MHWLSGTHIVIFDDTGSRQHAIKIPKAGIIPQFQKPLFELFAYWVILHAFCRLLIFLKFNFF